MPEDLEVAAAAIKATAAAAAAEDKWLEWPNLDGLYEVPAIHEAEQAAAAVAAETARATAATAAIEAGCDNGSDMEISEIFYHDPNTNAIYHNIADIPDGQ